MNKTILNILTCCVLSAAGCGSDDTSESSDESSESPTQATQAEGAGTAGSPAEDGAEAEADEATEQADDADDADDAAPGDAQDEADAAKPDDAAPAADASEDETDPADPAELDHTKDIRGNCDIDSGYDDDRACIPAPKPEEGFQIHVGPSNYDDPEEVAKFVMKPGEESSECFTFRMTNPETITFQTSVLSGRAGTHHIINTVYSGDLPTGDFGPCGGQTSQGDGVMQIGGLPGASKAYMPRSKVAPEFAHVGRSIPAEALVQSDMHYFNFTDKDILREFWINVYYAPEGAVTEQASGIRGLGGFGWNQNPIEPGTDNVYKYECPVKGDGHIMNLLGHYHAHGKRLTASIRRTNGDVEKVFEMFDYLDPASFDYNTVTQNPTFSDNQSGAVTGILPVFDGDALLWECHIINDGDVALRYINEVQNGEMCNLWGFSVGNEPISCGLP